MNEIEQSFKKLMTRIGTAMLIFLGAFTVAGVLIEIFGATAYRLLKEPLATVVYHVIYAIFYALPFAVAAIFLFVATKKDSVPASKKLSVPALTPVYIIVVIAITSALAYLNQYFVSVFNYGEFTDKMFFTDEYSEGYKIALQLLTTAVIPGIFEELLFRGAVLTRLRPYGKSVAIIISAVLFGLMHQNAGQFLYATAAGIILGWITVQTGSLVCAMICHFLNNAWAVTQQVIFEKCPSHIAPVIVSIAETAILVLGLVGAAFLIFRYYKRRKTNDFSNGMFGRSLEFERELPSEISPTRAVKLFFSPTIIVFVALAGALAVLLLFASMMYSFVGLV